MGLKQLKDGKRKREQEQEQEQEVSQLQGKGKKRREEPAGSAQKVFNIAELHGAIADELITYGQSQTISSLNSFRLTNKLAYLAEKSVPGLSELKKQVATLREVLRKGAVHYALEALEAPGVHDATDEDIFDALKDLHLRKEYLSEEQTNRLVSVLHARPGLYDNPISFNLIPSHEMPRATAALLNIENIHIRSSATLLASAHAKDMTDESKRHVNNAIRSLRAETWRHAESINWEKNIRENARKAHKAMMKYPMTSAQRHAVPGSRRPTAGTERLSSRTTTTPQTALPAQAVRFEPPSSYDEIVKTLNDQTRVRTARSLNAQPSTAQGAHGGHIARENRPTLLVNIYTSLQRLLNDTNSSDFTRCVAMSDMATLTLCISPREELERIRNATRHRMDERGNGQGSVAD